MGSQTLVLYFRTLAVLATVLLWGISLYNGTVKALLLAAYNGTLQEGVPLKTDYSGIPIVDYPIALLVAFFFYGTNGYDPGYQHFLLDAYSTLQSAFVWLYVESLRSGRKAKWIGRPVLFGLLWQALGAAISLPLYYSIHVLSLQKTQHTQVLDVRVARAIPMSFLLGAVLPAVIGMMPTWLGRQSRSDTSHQIILAAWQPDPLWVCVIQMAITSLGSFFDAGKETTSQTRTAFAWVRRSYLIAAASSAVGHLYVMIKILSSIDERMSFSRMYIPTDLLGLTGDPNIFVRGPWLFLQYDLLIIALSSLSWAFVLLCHAYEQDRVSKAKLALLLFAGHLTIGPGATVSLALFVREGKIQDSIMWEQKYQ